MQECSALLEFLCNYAGFKIVQGSFCGRFCASPRLCDACQFCFTIALEAALFAGGLSCFAAVYRQASLAWL